ncbi:hypothetical protein BpHYR1_035147 [Brachionus plicatilis]|uniref:Uncharacterized protein n=1 Tax=Brachionus plicatilis TaxID=10195 RepID=A0A3M7SDS2_BRAPC|nr:hypothetical protein BpHYR1_035147 [Brachionus plicatilis]
MLNSYLRKKSNNKKELLKKSLIDILKKILFWLAILELKLKECPDDGYLLKQRPICTIIIIIFIFKPNVHHIEKKFVFRIPFELV